MSEPMTDARLAELEEWSRWSWVSELVAEVRTRGRNIEELQAENNASRNAEVRLNVRIDELEEELVKVRAELEYRINTQEGLEAALKCAHRREDKLRGRVWGLEEKCQTKS